MPGQNQLVGFPTSPGVGFGVVVHILGEQATSDRVEGVVVADELNPGDVTSLDTAAVTAVATAAGAPLSHSSIVARSRGIPTVTGLGPDVLELPQGTFVLVDGDAGTVQISPTSGDVDAARARQREVRHEQDEARRFAATPAVTRDGYTVLVLANVGSAEDAGQAVSEGADGIGMLRTEFAFLDRREPPDEQEQYVAYRAVADAIGERPLVVRTLDLGADVPAWNPQPESNPALGNRGLRLTLSSPELFTGQVRAFARLAAERSLGVMFPMVTTVEELRRARAYLDEATQAQPPAGVLQIGITVEVPAAALTAEVFAPLVDFFAIGTNDLTQYTLAVDRANATVASLADGLHPGVLQLIGKVTEAAERHRRPVCVVGELACDRLGVPLLLGLGVTTLSVRPNAVAEVKQVVREVDIADARDLAQAAREAESAGAVRELTSEYWGRDADEWRNQGNG
jgi:phosphoenolpyruvate-protein phosphotransferase